ncbi:unnamed protein product [Clonostachys byssicola]|uniref:Enoyl reductase (ER) domain-containing protein n=1 Tax=Clonostachys byssicola TaxID=160290 RepID=A0A9N9YBK8_9HYPO|nr:unnamed protein product [Clonostachys byssicola]
MRQILVRRIGGPEVLELSNIAQIPSPANNQVLIKNSYAGVNFIDTYFRKGSLPCQLPTCLGMEAAGTVVAINGENKTNLSVGDLVVWKGQGAYAEYSTADIDNVVRIPQGISDRDAVGAFLPGMTALSLITEAYPVKNGEAVLVHAAAGNVGQLLCQMLRNIGAFVVGTAGSPQKCAMAKEYGAHECIDYSENKQWLQEALALTSGECFDVGEDFEMCHDLLLYLHDAVFDSVGATTWDCSLAITKRKGKVVSFGHSSGRIPPFDITRLLEKNLSIARVALTQYITTRDELLHFANMLFESMLQGKLKVNYHAKEYALQDISRAHEDLETRQTSGRVLVKM